MALDKPSYELLAGYLSGNISSADRASIETWISESQENKLIFEEVQKLWNSSGIHLHYNDLDSDLLLNELKLRISEEQKPIGKIISMIKPYVLHWQAAALLCLLMSSYFVVRWATTRENITIEAGDQVATVYLPDSTKVWLNVNSRITYPRKFESRKIELQGEAFLSVRKDTSDFTVTTRHTSTTVLGTAFNIKDEEEDSVVTLTVAEGTVKFSKSDSLTQAFVIVKPQQKSVFKSNSKLQKTQNDDPSFAAWRERNNPAFEEEKNNHARFLTNKYTWRKNQINQSVIEGTFTNSASLAAYTDVVLEVTYTKPNGNKVTVDLTITDTVYPGKRLQYRRRLLDILTDTKSITVKIKSVNVTSKNSY
jgi:ferric-dicitrate binding protein FerR (iron transport regulator)